MSDQVQHQTRTHRAFRPPRPRDDFYEMVLPRAWSPYVDRALAAAWHGFKFSSLTCRCP